MKRYLLKGLLSITVAVGLIFPAGWAEAYEIQTMPGVTTEMLQADYWIDKRPEPDRVIMEPARIADFNMEIARKLPDVTYLPDYPASISREWLTSLIDYPFPADPSYIGEEAVSASYWKQLRRQMNLEGIRPENPVRYGLTVRRSDLKVYPTADVVGDAPGDPGYDRFQNSSILAAEPMVILHQSADRKWYFAQIYNCAGWAPAEDIAVCDRNTWLAYQNEPDFLVVAGNRVRLDSDPLLPQISELEFTMGTRLPLAKQEEVPDSIRERRVYQNYVVKLPVRNKQGKAEFVLAPVPVSADVSVGYMPYTGGNVIRQAFKTQGERYGWGGMLNARDCSALVLEIYRCFGFRLPRNTTGQAVSAGKTLNFDGYSVAYRGELLKNLSPGATLFFKGHEMLYLGEEAGRYYVFSDLGNFAEPDPEGGELQIVRARTVVINDLDVLRASGKRWIEDLTAAKLLEKTSFADLEGHPDRALIESLADNYILQGVSADRFDPQGTVSRAEFAAMLGRLLKLEPDRVAARVQFADISDQWYAGAVGAAVKAGLFRGGGNGLFYPESPLTATEAAEVLSRAYAISGAGPADGELTQFSESGGPVTRAEAAVLLNDLLNKPI